MRLRLATRHRDLLVATGEDARELDDQGDELGDLVTGNGASASLDSGGGWVDPTAASDHRYTQPAARRRAGFTS